MNDADLKTYYENAMLALNLCENSKLNKQRVSYKETRKYEILLNYLRTKNSINWRTEL